MWVKFFKSIHWAVKERVYVLPYKTVNGKLTEVLVRDEPDKFTNRVLTVVGGGRDIKDGKTDKWHINTAKRELLEETGYNVHEGKLEEIGAKRFKSNEQCDYVYCVDVTDERAGKPTTDGSVFEKQSKNKFVSVDDFKKLVENSSDQALLTAAIHFLFEHNLIKSRQQEELNKTNVSNKPSQSDMGGNAKVGSRQPYAKYDQRVEVMPGVYKYDYANKDGKNKGPQPKRDQQVQMYEQIKQIMSTDPYASKLTRYLTAEDYDALTSILYAKGLQPDEQTVIDEINIIKQMIGTKASEYIPSQRVAAEFKNIFRKAVANPEGYLSESQNFQQKEINNVKLQEPDAVFYRTRAKMPDEVIILLKTNGEFFTEFKQFFDITMESLAITDVNVKEMVEGDKKQGQL